MATDSHLKKNIELRCTFLGLEHKRICEALGMSENNWWRMRTGNNPRLDTLKKIALILAVPHTALFEKDARKIIDWPVPEFDHLDMLAKQRESLGFGVHVSDSNVPEWDEWLASLEAANG